jgi:superfamily II DNA or RNA helicase
METNLFTPNGDNLSANVKVYVDKIYVKIFSTDEKIHTFLKNALYREMLDVIENFGKLPKNKQFRSYGNVKGYSFYRINDKNKSFGYTYRGFLPDILKLFQQKNIPYELYYNTNDKELDELYQNLVESIPEKVFSKSKGEIALRDYQILAIQQIFRLRYGYLHLATGAGKTMIAGATIRVLQDNHFLKEKDKGDVLFVVNTIHLVKQTIQSFKDLGIKNVYDLDKGYYKYKEGNIVYVTTMQKLISSKYKKLIFEDKDENSFLNNVKVLFLDECHHQVATTWRDLVRACKNVSLRIGLTATPFKTIEGNSYEDGFLIGLLGNVLLYVPYHYLRDKGYLSDVRIIIKQIIRKSLFHNVNLDELKSDSWWLNTYREWVVYNKYLYEETVDICKKNEGKKILILTYLVEHSEFLKDLLKKDERITEQRIILVNGKEGKDINTKELNKIDSFILITTTVFDEGIDLPELDVVIMLTGMKSTIKTIQRAGRGSRKTHNKDISYVYDFEYPNCHLLQKHFLKRLSIYQVEGFNFGELSEESCVS